MNGWRCDNVAGRAQREILGISLGVVRCWPRPVQGFHYALIQSEYNSYIQTDPAQPRCGALVEPGEAGTEHMFSRYDLPGTVIILRWHVASKVMQSATQGRSLASSPLPEPYTWCQWSHGCRRSWNKARWSLGVTFICWCIKIEDFL